MMTVMMVIRDDDDCDHEADAELSPKLLIMNV